MKSTVLLFLSAVHFSVFATLALPQLPDAVYADTEVSTNIPFAVNYDRLDKLTFVFDLTVTATNNFEVLLGCDTDQDGRLSVEESLLSFGYDCGAWFSRQDGATAVEASSVDGCVRREVVLRRTVVDPSWNLMRIVRRGLHVSDETLSVQIENKRFVIVVR